MSNANFAIPKAYNEPVKAYLPGSPEREALKKELDRQACHLWQKTMQPLH